MLSMLTTILCTSLPSSAMHPLRQYSFQGLMIVIATGFIPISAMSIVSAMVMRGSIKWPEKNTMWSIGKTNSRKAWVDALAIVMDITEIMLKMALNTIQSISHVYRTGESLVVPQLGHLSKD